MAKTLTRCRIAQGIERYIVDGLEFDDPDSSYLSDGEFPPFVVFDVDAQENVALNFPTREEAQAKADELNAKEKQ